MRKKFSFIYPVTRKNDATFRRDLNPYEHVADLVINGEAYIAKANLLNNISNKYCFNIHEILFDGRNIYPHTDIIEPLENIKAACLNHVEELFIVPETKGEKPLPRIYPALAKIITLPLRRKVR